MELILLKEVPGLGDEGDIKNVKNGYARNYLLPNKMAVLKTKKSLEILESQKQEIEAKLKSKKEEYTKLKGQIEEIKSISISVKTGNNDKLYGTITTGQISDILKNEHNVEIDKKKIILKNQIKVVGKYSISIHLMKDINAKLDLEILSQ